MAFPLTVIAGNEAREQLAEHGWQPELFKALVGASGGAKLLGIAHLDRMIFTDFLGRSNHSMELYGSSIGSWRHAALASADKANAIKQLQYRYLNQTWDQDDPRPAQQIVDNLCEWVLDGFLNQESINSIVDHPRFTTHIVTARGRGLNNRANDWLLGIGMAASAIGNLVHRKLLSLGFQRVVFSSGPSRAFTFQDFDTLHVPLTQDLLKPALLASGSIPFLMRGVNFQQGAAPGQYWDGGVVDYHFDFSNQTGEGMVLYPHFDSSVIKGWFDKQLLWRRTTAKLLRRTVVIAPSDNYIKQLPSRKIPDRKDFFRYNEPERLKHWQTAVEQSKALAAAFEKMISHPDPLAYLKG